MSESVLNKTKNWYRCVGVVSEKGLTREACEVAVYDDGKPTGEKVKAECIKGKVAIRTSTGIQTFGIYFTSKGMDGKDSKDWGMAQAMMDKWNPEINGDGSEPTVVALEGMAEINDYVGQNGIRSSLQYRVRRANTRVTPDEPHAMTLNVTTYIQKIVPETRNDEETGRLLVTLYGANGKGACFPIDAIVEEDLADDFEEAYEVGQTVNFDIDIVTKHIGGTKGKKAFGKGGAVNVNSGFDITEAIIVGAEDPIEEPDELTTEDEDGNEVPVKTEWINPVAMKKAIKVRAAMLEELAKSGGEDKKGGGKSMKERKAEAKAKKMGGTKPKPQFDEDEDDDDSPF